jgi:hypothetical protein
MTAFLDEAAAFDTPPRADVGAAASSSLGGSGRRSPEDLA